jgi:signal transduction histidine kinase
LARDIHDILAQDLVGIIIQLQVAERAPARKLILTGVTEARRLAEEALAEARRSVKALRASELESSNLTRALEQTVREMQSQSNAQIEFRVEGEPYPLPANFESNLLRIGQEAVRNALRHSHAQEILIALAYKPGRMSLTVQDNGAGFDLMLVGADTYGLVGMRERAEQIGASLRISSEPGQGARIELLVPVDMRATERPLDI